MWCSFLNFGDPSRRLATADPEINYYLPVDDQSFLEGVCNVFFFSQSYQVRLEYDSYLLPLRIYCRLRLFPSLPHFTSRLVALLDWLKQHT
jgi:hypothetical protein